MNRILCLFAALSLFSSLAGAAAAQTQTETLHDLMPPSPSGPQKKGVDATIRLFDSVLIHPLPDWMPKEMQGDPFSSTLFNRQQDKNLFRMEMVPKEETFENWRNLYAVMGLRNYPGTNATHARQIVGLFETACRPSNINIRPLQGNPTIALLIVACGSFSKQPDRGQVAVFVLLQREKTAVRLYREWRAPAFRAEDPGQWPVKRKTLNHVIAAMTKARLVPAGKESEKRP